MLLCLGTTQVEAKLCNVEEDGLTFDVYLYVTVKGEKVIQFTNVLPLNNINQMCYLLEMSGSDSPYLLMKTAPPHPIMFLTRISGKLLIQNLALKKYVNREDFSCFKREITLHRCSIHRHSVHKLHKVGAEGSIFQVFVYTVSCLVPHISPSLKLFRNTLLSFGSCYSSLLDHPMRLLNYMNNFHSIG